jgi:biotin carboxyl carrier protein
MWVTVEDPEVPGKRRRVAVVRLPGGVWVGFPGGSTFLSTRPGDESGAGAAAAADEVRAPMTGRVVQVLVKGGDVVEMGASLVVLEAMKMEYRLTAPRAGEVERVSCREGELVDLHAILVTLCR